MKRIYTLIQLSRNDIRAKYANSILGIVWAFAMPLVTILVFWYVFQLGFKNLPVCIAKTQYSLSTDPKKLGRPTGFVVNVSDVSLSAGAGFLVVLTGNIMTMPGLSKTPAANFVDVVDGNIVGLF